MKLFITILCLTLFWVITANAGALQILTAPDGTEVIILRDEYGVPHIKGETEIGVFFGQGFAAMQDRHTFMQNQLIWSVGRVAKTTGSWQDLESDKERAKMSHTNKERVQVFNELPLEIQDMLDAFCQGINAFIDTALTDPLRHISKQFIEYGLSIEYWTVYDLIASIQYYVNYLGFGGEELERLNELQKNGWDWFNENRPINDPDAFVTIKDNGKPALNNFHYSGVEVNQKTIDSYIQKRERLKALEETRQIFTGIGCYDAAFSGGKSESGNIMLLNNKRLSPGVNLKNNFFYEVELDCPTFSAAGMNTPIFPGLWTGNNEYYGWSATDGLSDYIDVYIDSTKDNTFSSYYHNGEWLDFEVIQDTLYKGNTAVPFTHYRTIHGPVFHENLEAHQVFSKKVTSWDKELSFLINFYRFLKAKNLSEFEDIIKNNPRSENYLYLGKDQTIKYWHTGIYQDRKDGVDPRLPHKGDGSEEWVGFIPFEDLPQIENPEWGYIFHWNNKPISWWNNGDNVFWIGNAHPNCVHNPPCTDLSVPDDMFRNTSKFSFDDLKNFPWALHTNPAWFDWHNPRSMYEEYLEISPDWIKGANRLPPGNRAGFESQLGLPEPHATDQWELYENWEHKRKKFGELENPQVLNLYLDQHYIDPGKDKLNITAELVNLKDHNAKVVAQYLSADSTCCDSVELVADSQNANGYTTNYTGIMTIPVGEQNFKICATATDLDDPCCIDFEGDIRFTTIGPVILSSYEMLMDTIANPGDDIYLKMVLTNNSSTTTATDVSASITSLDSFATIGANNKSSKYGDIGPGEIKKSIGIYKITVFDGPFPVNPYELHFAIDIQSEGHSFWKDTTSILVGIEDNYMGLPKEFALFQNYPNPFNPTTVISYQLPVTSHIDLNIYNLIGQKIATLVSAKQQPGNYKVEWDASGFASGVYLYRFSTDKGFVQTRKLILLK